VIFLELTRAVTSLTLLIIIYLPNVARHQPSVNGVEWCVGGGGRLDVSGDEAKACVLPLTVVWFVVIGLC
jgi:hypothetical protein